MSLSSNKGSLVSGIFISSTDWFPIISGVPRLLTGDLKQNLLSQHAGFFNKYFNKMPKHVVQEWSNSLKSNNFDDHTTSHQLKTGSSFAYEWEKIYKENNYERQNYLHFLSPYLKSADLVNKLVVDLGCGSGRFTKQASLLGAKVAIGVDLGESVETAYRLCRGLSNVLIVQADIYHLPFKPIFDVAQSIGVLHHLPNPQAGFASCATVLNKTGRILIWVYNRRNNNRALYFYEPLRSLSRQLPKPILYKLCYFPAAVVHLINLLTKNIPNAPFGYYRNFPFNMKLNDAFDVLSTPKSNYYYVEQIIAWFKAAKLKKILAFEHPEAGITCIGTK